MCHVSWYENCTARGPYAKDFKTTPRAWIKFEHPPPKGDNSNIRLIIRPTSFQAKHCNSRHVSKNESLDPFFSRSYVPCTLAHEIVHGHAAVSLFCCFWNLLASRVSHSWKKWLKWNWNGHWEWLQEAWTLKIDSNEPEMCWGCTGGRGLFVVSKRVSQHSIEHWRFRH